MKILSHAVSLLVLLALSSLTGSAQSGRTVLGKVSEITDGHTFTLTVTNTRRMSVKLYGVAAPQSPQPLHETARRHLYDLASGKEVKVVVKGFDEDRNVVIGRLYAAGTDVGAQMIRDGAAWHHKESISQTEEELNLLYSGCQEAAKKERRGVWKEDDPTPPWEFARRHAEEEARRNPGAFAKSQRTAFDTAIRQSKVLVGMEYADVRRAWGTPNQAATLFADGQASIWRYRFGQVTFVNGRVTEVILVKGK